MPENEDFCLSFELFSWVSDFLSFGVLEFFSGVHKKSLTYMAMVSMQLLDNSEIISSFLETFPSWLRHKNNHTHTH